MSSTSAEGAWDRLWFARFDPHSVGLFRISLGLLVVACYLATAPSWDRFYSSHGVNALEFGRDRLSLFWLTDGLVPARAFFWLGLAAAVAFTAGFFTRAATVLLYAIQSSMIHSAPQVTNGEDLVFRMLLFYGCFAPLGAALSVDAWRRARRDEPAREQPAIWAVRLMQINVALIYAISLPCKLLDDTAWWDGSAIYLSMASNMWTRWPWPGVFYGFLSKIATWGTILVEGSFPILVWFPRPRPYVLGAVVLLHLSIAVVLANVTFFSLSVVCAFWLFVPGETSRRWLERIRLGRSGL